MSKSFRARQLDSNKPLPVYRAEELPDLTELSAINRAVPQMPTGMEKEEETEHHLQRAISAQQVYGDTQQLVIPTPDTEEIKDKVVEFLYHDPFKQPKQYIHVQAFNFEEELPEYDMDSEDEEWLKNFNKKKELLTPFRFEQFLDQLERNSGNQVVSLNEAKSLLKEGGDIIKPLYEYWMNKRKKLKDLVISLTPQLKGEKRDGSSASDPYVAFRRRTEKMQTRKNRKNDEASYEKMLKLRRDLNRACTILDMVKRREQSKKEHLQLTIQVFEKRYAAGDFAGQILQQCMDMIRYQPPATNLTVPTSAGYGENVTPGSGTGGERDHELWRRGAQERARAGKNDYLNYNELGIKRPKLSHPAKAPHIQPSGDQILFSDDEEPIHVSPPPVDIPSEPEDDEEDPDGRFAFKRKLGVRYIAPRFDMPEPLPWVDPSEGGLGDRRFRFSCTSISSPQRVIGFARRRVGRGGRIYMDRGYSPLSEDLDELDMRLNALPSSSFSLPNGLFPYDHLTGWKKPSLLHFRPKSPPAQVSLSSFSSSSSSESPPSNKQSGEPRPRLHRSFSTQQRSKFSLNPTPTNGVVGPNFTHSTLNRSSLPNGPLSNQGGYTTGTLLSKNAAYSTAPMKTVYALNFPVTNNLVRGSAPFSPTSHNSSPSTGTVSRANAAESSGVEQMELDANRADALLDGLGTSVNTLPNAT
nr:enhancer of polycomb homolog 1-like isoform X1 [Pocillopora verrucosa]